MPTLNIGWEDGNMKLNGADVYVQTNRAITITGYQISTSELPFAVMGDMVLMQLAALPTAPVFTSTSPAYIANAPANPDFGPPTVNNPNNSPLGGGIGGAGIFFSAILKSANGNAANVNVAVSGLNIPVPSGGYIVAHMDGGGSTTKTTDGEIQGCIYYT